MLPIASGMRNSIIEALERPLAIITVYYTHSTVVNPYVTSLITQIFTKIEEKKQIP